MERMDNVMAGDAMVSGLSAVPSAFGLPLPLGWLLGWGGKREELLFERIFTCWVMGSFTFSLSLFVFG